MDKEDASSWVALTVVMASDAGGTYSDGSGCAFLCVLITLWVHVGALGLMVHPKQEAALSLVPGGESMAPSLCKKHQILCFGSFKSLPSLTMVYVLNSIFIMR